MDLNKDFRTFVCALAQDDHFFIKPITLLCGHAVCYNCVTQLKFTNRINNIRCELCGKDNVIDLDVIAESLIATNLINKSMDELFHEMKKRYENLLNQFKGKISESKCHFNTFIDYAKEEIHLKAQSLKNEINLLEILLIKKIDDLKVEYEYSIVNFYEKPYESYLKQLVNMNENKYMENEVILDKIQSSLKELNESIKYFSVFTPQINFISNDEKLDISLIGTFENNYLNILQKINTNYYEVIDLDYEIRGICTLEKNNYLITASSNQHCLTIFDKNLNIIKEIDQIDSKQIYPRYIATNNIDKIYIVQSSLNKISVIDYHKYNFIKEYGGDGLSTNQFNLPLGICYFENSVFVCDSLNYCIQKLSDDLVFEDKYQLNYKPWDVKICNNYMCVRPNSNDNIYIYNLKPFKCIKTISDGNGAIFGFKYWFYELSLNKHLNCYDLSGKFIDRINISILEEFDISDGQIFLEYFNGNLILSCKNAKKFILLR